MESKLYETRYNIISKGNQRSEWFKAGFIECNELKMEEGIVYSREITSIQVNFAN